MNLKKIFLPIIFCLQTAFFCFSQTANNNAQLASKYYQNGEYDKALPLYEELYRQTDYKSYRDMYLSCFNLLHEYDEAEKFLKKEIKKKKNDLYLLIDLGMVYYNTNRTSDSKTYFDKAKSSALTSETNVSNVANAFIFYRQYENAIRLYEDAATKFKKNYGLEIGNIYYLEKNYALMMQHYLTYLTDATLANVEAKLTNILATDTDNSATTIIEKAILEELQKKPSSSLLNNLTIWLYSQTARYPQALNQLIAFNKRMNANDKEINDFANAMVESGNFDIATQAFNFLITKKPQSSMYAEAFIGYLEVSYKQATASIKPDITKLKDLDSTINIALQELPITKAYKIIIASAQIKAYYLDKHSQAIEVINNAISSNYYKDKTAELKLLLGDIYLLNNNPWDATLLYAQVEKSNSGTEMVNLARFKKAKLAYYIGQFAWSQAQLDVLKAGTTRLISNDAIELSLFITENYDMDTTETTMQTFARADFFTFSKQYNKALQCLDSIQEKYKSHTLIDDVIFRKAKIYELTCDFEKAKSLYEQVFTTYSFDILADNALFAYAEICYNRGEKEAAKEAYFKLISDYSGSIFTVEARKKLRLLN